MYVFDSGIDVDHPDFGGRASMEANFIDYEDDADNAGHGNYIVDVFVFVKLKIICL